MEQGSKTASEPGSATENGVPPQDTPGRPKASSSRQQTQPNQGTQSGSPELDAKDAGSPQEQVAAKYRDRPADEGKHGDGAQQPNSPRPSKT